MMRQLLQLPFLDILQTLFGMVAIVSMVACLAYYCVTRVAAQTNWLLNLMGAGAVIAFLFIMIAIAGAVPAYTGALLWLLVCSGLGSLLQRSSSSKTPGWWSGLLVMLVVAKATLAVSFFALILCEPLLPYFSDFLLGKSNALAVDQALVFAFTCFTAPLAGVTLLRIFQVTKLRPGLDCHLTEELAQQRPVVRA